MGTFSTKYEIWKWIQEYHEVTRMCKFTHDRAIDDNSTTINVRNIMKAIAREIELFRYERTDGLINVRVRWGKMSGVKLLVC